MLDPPEQIHLKTLARIANGDSPSEILADICLHFEKATSGTVARVTILDRMARVFQYAVFPSFRTIMPMRCRALKLPTSLGPVHLQCSRVGQLSAGMSTRTGALALLAGAFAAPWLKSRHLDPNDAP